MTKDEAIAKLKALGTSDDKEGAHMQADQILLDVLVDAGLADVAAAWEQARDDIGGFWYA